VTSDGGKLVVEVSMYTTMFAPPVARTPPLLATNSKESSRDIPENLVKVDDQENLILIAFL
jgi:hypothetical protein